MDMEEMDLREYWEIIIKKRVLILVVLFLVVLAVTIYSLVATPIYEATTTVIVQEQGASQMLFLDGFSNMGKNQAQNYIQIMKSRNILEQVHDRAGLSEEYDLIKLAKKLNIQPVQGSDLLAISIQSSDPEEAQLIVNSLADVFINWNTLYRQDDVRSAREFIQRQLITVEENLKLAEENLKQFREDEKLLSPTEETIAGIGQLANLEKLQAEADIAIRETQERIERVHAKLSAEEETFVSSTTIGENAFVTQYRARLADLEISLSGAREKYTDLHPSVLAIQAEIEDIKEKLADQVERVIGTETRTVNPIHRELYGSLIDLEVGLNAYHARKLALQEIIDSTEDKLGLLPQKELQLVRLMRDSKVLEELYVMLRTKVEETRITEAMQTADVHVIDTALLPELPVKPRVKLNIAISIVLGAFLGVGLAFLIEFMDNTVKTKEDAERLLGIPVLGQIPDFDFGKSMEKRKIFTRKRV
ncbi:MAG TPA: hypothetical protein GXZ55_11215 [Natronincola sp.]|nr:hypothetical protein [Natronincola sp.]